MPKSLKSTRRIVALAAIAIWAVSLALPAASFDNPGYAYVPGALVAMVGLVFGWSILQIGAFANVILLILAIRLVINRSASVILAAVMEVLALLSFTWSDFPDDRGPNLIKHFSSGFYAWQLAILLLAAYALAEKQLIARGFVTAAVEGVGG